jgi:hypothetical protein
MSRTIHILTIEGHRASMDSQDFLVLQRVPMIDLHRLCVIGDEVHAYRAGSNEVHPTPLERILEQASDAVKAREAVQRIRSGTSTVAAPGHGRQPGRRAPGQAKLAELRANGEPVKSAALTATKARRVPPPSSTLRARREYAASLPFPGLTGWVLENARENYARALGRPRLPVPPTPAPANPLIQRALEDMKRREARRAAKAARANAKDCPNP